MKDFAGRLKSKRLRLGLSQAELAELLAVSVEWVSKSERGASTPLEITQEGALARMMDFGKGQKEGQKEVGK